jgi:hypothetical protein
LLLSLTTAAAAAAAAAVAIWSRVYVLYCVS